MRHTGLILLVTIFLLSGCAGINAAHHPYDFSTKHFEGGLEQYAKDWPRIATSGKPVVISPNGTRSEMDLKTSEGRALVIPPYVLTLYHIVDLSKVSVSVITPFGLSSASIQAQEVLEQAYWLQDKDGTKIPLEQVKLFTDDDLALFKLPPDASVSHNGLAFGNSADLKIGNVVFLLGSPDLAGPITREGIVAALGKDISQEWSEGVIRNVAEIILLSTRTIYGDSGSPVVALKRGRPELIGIDQARVFEELNLSIIIPINVVLDRIKRATGINLRKLNEEHIRKLNSK